MPRAYPLLGMLGGYLLVMLTNPVRVALRDGFRCTLRFKRLWLLFALFAFAYSTFLFAVFTPLQSTDDLRLEQLAFLGTRGIGRSFPRFGARACSTRSKQSPES